MEPQAIAAVVATLAVALGGLLYLIRAEIRRNTVATEATHAQLIPDHSLSLRDAVDRIEKRLDEVHTDVRAARSELSDHITWHLGKD